MKKIKILKSLIKPISTRLFFLILGIALSISFASVYAAWNTNVSSGQTLTSTLWNEHVSKLIDLDSRVDSLESAGGSGYCQIGGYYRKTTDQSTCTFVNPLTGACSCPSGYTAICTGQATNVFPDWRLIFICIKC